MGNNGPKVVINNEDLDVHMVVAETFKPIDNQDKNMKFIILMETRIIILWKT